LVNAISIARETPSIRGSHHVVPESGTRPIAVNAEVRKAPSAAVDRPHHRHPRLKQGVDRRMEHLVEQGGEVGPFGALIGGEQLDEVGSRAERPARSGEDRRPTLLPGPIHGKAETFAEGRLDRVEPVRSVQGYHCDIAVEGVVDAHRPPRREATQPESQALSAFCPIVTGHRRLRVT
jgi:hypothetical protein